VRKGKVYPPCSRRLRSLSEEEGDREKRMNSFSNWAKAEGRNAGGEPVAHLLT